MKPYVMASPQYNITSGGVKVMWGLYGWLLSKGLEVYMNQVPNDRDIVAIYPEIFHGNPANAKTVVRYILNTPGVMGANGVPGPTIFDRGDILYYFSRMFGYSKENRYMFLPIINLKEFRDLKRARRRKTCYLIGKGKNKFIHPQGSIELNREMAKNQSELNDLLNDCHTLYCYDNLTAMMEVARLSGCAVKYFGDYTEEEIGVYEPGLNGVSFNGKSSKLKSDEFREKYISLVKEFEIKLDEFIEETQK